MPTPSKFTAERKQRILEALSTGCSKTTAAQIAGITEGALRLWLKKGEAQELGSYREFYEKVQEAEAHPRMRALGVIYNEIPNRPDLAWKFIERREPGYAPPSPNAQAQPQGPVVIQLAFSSRSPMELVGADVIEGEAVEDEPDGTVSGTAIQPA